MDNWIILKFIIGIDVSSKNEEILTEKEKEFSKSLKDL